jgi:histidinol dehydrogenase
MIMKLVSNPEEEVWDVLVERPMASNEEIYGLVKPIIDSVRSEGDSALLRYTKEFDRVQLSSPVMNSGEIAKKALLADPELRKAIDTAYENIRKFHEAQQERFSPVETAPGVLCWRESRAIENVGLYIPGGTAPLFSTLMMLGVPARIAGCSRIVVCTPPNEDGSVHPALAYIAERLQLDEIYLAGGAQAIAAMALGTESIPRVYKIFGPGNQYVSAAKNVVAREFGIAVDLPAGPTELLILADDSAKVDFVAADILSQAEHGADSQVVLISNSEALLEEVNMKLSRQLETLPRRKIAELALESSYGIYFPSLDQAMSFSNRYAPEHLILAVSDCEAVMPRIVNAGSVFLGSYTPESFGDYASGTNHTLPTNGASRSYSGVSLESFQKKITFQQASEAGLLELGTTVEIMAKAEGLEGHAEAVRVRMESVQKKGRSG